MVKFTSVLAAAGFAMLPLASQAATPTLGEVLKASGISANGYVDFGTTVNNRSADGVGGIGGLGAGAAGGAKNGAFRLNQVGLTVTTALSDNFSGTLDVLAGNDALAIATDTAGDIKLKQGYISYKNGGLTVMGGRFITLAGAEVINSSQNANATRSYLFTLQPALHTGVRTSYAFGNVVTLTGGLVNSAVATAPNENNKNKAVELQVAFVPFDGFSNAVTMYQGIEPAQVAGSPDNKVNPLLIDVVSSLQITKALSVGLNYDHIRNTGAAAGYGSGFAAGASPFANAQVTNGIALYSSFQLCDALRLGGRAEYVRQTNNAGAGTLGTDINVQTYTLTSEYGVSKNFSVLSDLRFDKATGYGAGGAVPGVTPFANSTNAADAGNALTSLTVKGIYRF